MVAPVLLSEISADENRGAITTTHQLMITLGNLFAALVGYAFVVTIEHGWQYAQLFILVPAILQLLLASYLPESPRWLCQEGKIEEARASVEMIRFSLNTEEDRLALEAEIDAMILESGLSIDKKPVSLGGDEESNPVDQQVVSLPNNPALSETRREEPTWSEVFSHKKAMVIGITLMSMMILTGMSALIFYSTTIFGYAGVDQVFLFFFIIMFFF